MEWAGSEVNARDGVSEGSIGQLGSRLIDEYYFIIEFISKSMAQKQLVRAVIIGLDIPWSPVCQSILHISPVQQVLRSVSLVSSEGRV